MYIRDYIKSRVWTPIDTDWVYWHQCVDQAKDFAKEVLGVSLWSFWGSAKTGWANKNNTFDPNVWERITNNPTDINQVPLAWDIIFFSWPDTLNWHVAVVLIAEVGNTTFTVINQNTGNWDGYGADDYTRIQKYDYNRVYGWYRKKWISPYHSILKYKKYPVIRKDIYAEDRPLVNASYSQKWEYIVLYDGFFKKSTIYQESILEHEFAHGIYYELPEAYQKLIELIYNFDKKIQDKIAKSWYKYTENHFLNDNAKKNHREDFCENIEYKVLVDNWLRLEPLKWDYWYIKYIAYNKIFDKFKNS